jgi:hypothetical protein
VHPGKAKQIAFPFFVACKEMGHKGEPTHETTLQQSMDIRLIDCLGYYASDVIHESTRRRFSK